MQIDSSHHVPSTVRNSAAPPAYTLVAPPLGDQDADSNGDASATANETAILGAGRNADPSGRGQALSVIA